MVAILPALAAAAATAGSAAASAAPAIMMGAAGVSAASSIVGGIRQNNIDRANSSAAATQADEDLATASERAQQQGTDTSRQIGEAVANEGASGVDPNQGSPLSAREDLASQGALAQNLTLWQGTNEAAAMRYQGSLDKAQGTQALISGFGNAGSTLMTAGINYAYMNPGGGTPGTSGFTGAPLAGSSRSAFSLPKF